METHTTRKSITERIKFIKRNPSMTMREMATSMQVTYNDIANLCKRHNLEFKRAEADAKQKKQRIAYIKANPHKTQKELSDALNISVNVISRTCNACELAYTSAKTGQIILPLPYQTQLESEIDKDRNLFLTLKWA